MVHQKRRMGIKKGGFIMSDTVHTTGLIAALNMLKAHTHHSNYFRDEDAFKFILAPNKIYTVIERHEYKAIIDTVTYMARAIYNTEDGKIHPRDILFRYNITDGDIVWDVKIKGELYATVVFNTAPGHPDGVFGNHLPILGASVPLPLAYGDTDVFKSNFITIRDAAMLSDIIMSDFFGSTDFNHLASILCKSSASKLYWDVPWCPQIEMKFLGDIAGSRNYTLKLTHSTSNDDKEFAKNVELIRRWATVDVHYSFDSGIV